MDLLAARQFGDYRPVQDFLGADTLEALAAPKRVESYIVQDGPRRGGVGFVGCTVLAAGPLLNPEQVARLSACILTPEAHYNGRPIYRPFPPVPISHFACGTRIGFLTCWLICTIRVGSFIVGRSVTGIGTGWGTSWSRWRKNCSLSLLQPVHVPSGGKAPSKPSRSRPSGQG